MSPLPSLFKLPPVTFPHVVNGTGVPSTEFAGHVMWHWLPFSVPVIAGLSSTAHVVESNTETMLRSPGPCGPVAPFGPV
jgi:hypothetical protein